MAHRISPLVAAGAATLVLCVALPVGAARATETGAHPPGRVAPAARAAAQESPVTIRWVFRTQDLFSCRTAVAGLRRAQAEYGSRLGISLVAVDVSPAYLASFLRNEKLRGMQETHLTETQYARAYQGRPTPDLLVISGNSVVGRFAAGGDPASGRRDISEMDGVLRRVFSSVAMSDVSLRNPVQR